MNSVYYTAIKKTISTQSYSPKVKKNFRYKFVFGIAVILLPLHFACILFGIIGHSLFNGLKKGWEIRL